MKTKLLIGLLLVLFYSAVHGLPNYISPVDFGHVPFTEGGLRQVKTQTLTICNDRSIAFPLAMELNIDAGNQLDEWTLSPNSYDPNGERCQDLTLTLTPESIGLKGVTILIDPCLEGANSCMTNLTVRAEVISEDDSLALKKAGLYRLAQYQYLDPDISNPQPVFDNQGLLSLISASNQLEVDVRSDNRGLSLIRKRSTPYNANLKLCSIGAGRILQLPDSTSNSAQVYNQNGEAPTDLQVVNPNCFSTVSADGRHRIVTGGCFAGENEIAGRVEVRYPVDENTLSDWGSVCDDFWRNEDAQVFCRSLGARSGSALCCAHCGRASGAIWLDDLHCSSTENSLFDCPHNGIGRHNCNHYEDAGVRCQVGEEPRPLPQAGCPDPDANILPLVTCPDMNGMRNLTLVSLPDADSSEPPNDIRTHFLNIPETSLGDFELIAYYYFPSGHLLAIGPEYSMILNQDAGGGGFSIHQIPVDIKGTLPVALVTSSNPAAEPEAEVQAHLFSFDQEAGSDELVLNRFDVEQGYLTNKQTYRQLPSTNPRYMTPIGNDKLLVSEGFRDGGITHLSLYMLTDESSLIPGLSNADIPIPTTDDSTPEITTAESTTQPIIERTVASSNRGGKVAGGFFGGAILGLLGIPAGLGIGKLIDSAFHVFSRGSDPMSVAGNGETFNENPLYKADKSLSDKSLSNRDLPKKARSEKIDLRGDLAPTTRPLFGLDNAGDAGGAENGAKLDGFVAPPAQEHIYELEPAILSPTEAPPSSPVHEATIVNFDEFGEALEQFVEIGNKVASFGVKGVEVEQDGANNEN